MLQGIRQKKKKKAASFKRQDSKASFLPPDSLFIYTHRVLLSVGTTYSPTSPMSLYTMKWCSLQHRQNKGSRVKGCMMAVKERPHTQGVIFSIPAHC